MTISPLHIRADGLIQNRKDILESAMESTLLLKNLKTVKELARQKKSQLVAFSKNIKEISALMSEFKLEDIQETKPKAKKIIKIPEKKTEIPAPVEKPKSKIEQDLEDIQEKLRNLSF